DRIGLEPAFPAEATEEVASTAWTRFDQPFTYAGRPRRTYDLSGEALSFGGRSYEHGTEFVVLAASAGESVTAPLSFVGYGLEEGQDGYTSFDEDTDLTGRVALLLRYEPLDDEGRSRWSDRRFSPYAGLTGKLEAVAARGAAGIILVNPPGAADGATGLETLQRSGRFAPELEIPVVQVTPETADALLELTDPEGRSLESMRHLADIRSVGTVNLADDALVTLSGQVDVQVDREEFRSANAGAVLRGRGGVADEWIVIGGHYDHLGYGRSGSMPGGRGQLHPGADDNASGTAGVLILAERLKAFYDDAAPDADLRSILFIGFGAEEVGLNGSAHYVNHPTVPVEQITLMINMDMIGRLRNDELMVGGSGTAVELNSMLETYGRASGLTLALSPGGRGPSDHTNFYGKGIPVLFLFTGLHNEYHRPGDHGYTVNPAGAMKILDLAELITEDVATRPRPLTFQSSEGLPAGGGPSRTGARVRLGIMPSYSAELETGVLVDGVTEDAPAAAAGVQGGDILLTWNGEELTGGRRLAELLRAGSPGDVVKLGVLRAGEKIQIEVTLQARESRD
ncbi:MAG: M28 family peptidase, partial [Planctomycetota bacterium]